MNHLLAVIKVAIFIGLVLFLPRLVVSVFVYFHVSPLHASYIIIGLAVTGIITILIYRGKSSCKL